MFSTREIDSREITTREKSGFSFRAVFAAMFGRGWLGPEDGAVTGGSLSLVRADRSPAAGAKPQGHRTDPHAAVRTLTDPRDIYLA